jgi:hypothetical protein
VLGTRIFSDEGLLRNFQAEFEALFNDLSGRHEEIVEDWRVPEGYVRLTALSFQAFSTNRISEIRVKTRKPTTGPILRFTGRAKNRRKL